MGEDAFVIEPPYDMKRLAQLAQENNALSQCIEAMEVNIDGTGFAIDKFGQTAEELKDDKDVQEVADFFKEPYPGMSFISMRRLLRRDLEITGNAYIEVIRNAQDEIVFLRRIEAMSMRLVKLGEAVPRKYKVKRKGREVEVTLMVRVRKFAQFINGTLVYFKEFGAKADLDKKTGEFAEGGARLPAKQRSTEIIHLTCIPDAKTPYGIPRWISQAPSVIGSRKAEEHNIDFFDSGGIPPVVVFLMGGGLTSPVRKQLEGIFAGTNTKSRGAVVEVQPMSSGLDSTANSTVRVERFGAERQNDSMFENYDGKCEKRIRSSFRLPPLFVGKSEDANYACYDAKTETLTDRGWITYDQYEEGMKIATYNKETGALEYQDPIGGGPLVYEVEDVIMYHFLNANMDLMVTPKHTMLYSTPKDKDLLKVTPIEEMLAKCARPGFVAKTAYFSGNTIDSFTPPLGPLQQGNGPLTDYTPKAIPADMFLQFMGWCLSEGCVATGNHALQLTQNEDKHWGIIMALVKNLESLGYAYWLPKRGMKKAVLVTNKSLTTWVRDSTGGLGHEKRVPRVILNLCPDQLRVFFEALMLAGGTWDSRKGRTSGAYATTSKQLADDVQEVALKLGYRTKLIVSEIGSCGKVSKRDNPVYRVLLSVAGCAEGDSNRYTVRYEDTLERVEYTGTVYCFSVPNGVFITRRNGCVAIQGNTAYASYTVAEAQVFQPERTEFDDAINLKLMKALNPKCKFRSLPLNVRDIESQLKAIGMLQLANVVAGEDLVNSVNETANLNVKYSQYPAIPIPEKQLAVGERDSDLESGGANPAKIPAIQSSPVGEQINGESNSKSPGKKVKKFSVGAG